MGAYVSKNFFHSSNKEWSGDILKRAHKGFPRIFYTYMPGKLLSLIPSELFSFSQKSFSLSDLARSLERWIGLITAVTAGVLELVKCA